MEIFSPSKGLACRGVFFMLHVALHALKCKKFTFLIFSALKCINFLFWKVFTVVKMVKSVSEEKPSAIWKTENTIPRSSWLWISPRFLASRWNIFFSLRKKRSKVIFGIKVVIKPQ